MQNGCMAVVQIRDVPDDVRDEFARRAAAAHQSLQQYLRTMLITQARRPDAGTIWGRVAERARQAGGEFGFQDAVDDVRALRDEGRSA